MNFGKFVNQVSRTYVLCSYLRDLCVRVGAEAYLRSLVRNQHGTGTGFFGVNNLGSTDCASHACRLVTDALGQTNKDWSGIDFRSASCLDVQPNCVRGNAPGHRVEHAVGVAHLYRELERRFIVPCQMFTPLDIANFIVLNQIVCLIETREQISHGAADPSRPFGRYSSRIFYRGEDVTDWSLEQIGALNAARYEALLGQLRRADFYNVNALNEAFFRRGSGRHKLPPLELAVAHGENELELLCLHYHAKRDKRITPGNKWYDAKDAERFHAWKNASGRDCV